MNKKGIERYNRYSIIVPSYNRRDEIEELLQSFLFLEFNSDRLELIIADDGSEDDTESLVKKYNERLPFPVLFCRQENKGPGAARNMGMEKASGDFYIFLDSDCTVPPDWLQNIDRNLHHYQADAFGGRDSFRPDFPDQLKAINYSMTSFITTGGLRGRKGKKLAKFYPRSFNMGLSRSLAEKIGGFGSLRHGQDIEYSHRIIKSGARIIYIDESVVYHKRRTSIKKFFRQVFNWGVARINLFKIDSSMLEPLHAAPAAVTILTLILILFSIFSSTVWSLFRWLLLAGVIILFLSGVHAAFKYRSLRMLYLVPVIMPIQIFGYGLGFISAYFYRVILGRPEFTGFHKKYYH
ncbi:MAG: glycosyltransferase [Calditrichaeota bacterium]|nr:glycosyltransferase [Calditrichota bacterium]RQW05067.1 MAG: glycosyltransferase [Calditrichota bacterium]